MEMVQRGREREVTVYKPGTLTDNTKEKLSILIDVAITLTLYIYIYIYNRAITLQYNRIAFSLFRSLQFLCHNHHHQHHHHHVPEGLSVFPVSWTSRWSWYLHLFLGLPMSLLPFGLYCSACFGSVFVSILCTCCSHFSWYCFLRLSWSLHLFPGLRMFLLPFGLYCSACFGSLFVSILCTCCSHVFWYCFISFTMFCAPVFRLMHWFFSLSSFVIPCRCLKNFICAASRRCSSLFFSTQASLPNFNAALGVMLWILNFDSLFISFPKCFRIAPFILLYVCNLSSKSLPYSDMRTDFQSGSYRHGRGTVCNSVGMTQQESLATRCSRSIAGAQSCMCESNKVLLCN